MLISFKKKYDAKLLFYSKTKKCEGFVILNQYQKSTLKVLSNSINHLSGSGRLHLVGETCMLIQTYIVILTRPPKDYKKVIDLDCS